MTSHKRETTTPMGDGTLLADCVCGGTYRVPQGGDEYAALQEAQRHHEADSPLTTYVVHYSYPHGDGYRASDRRTLRAATPKAAVEAFWDETGYHRVFVTVDSVTEKE